MSVVTYIIKRVNVWLICLRKDEPPQVYGYGFKRKGGTCRQEWEAEGWENVMHKGELSPCIVVFMGYGVVTKSVDSEHEIVLKVKQGTDFLWREEKERNTLHFIRRAQADGLLEEWGKKGVPIADVQVRSGSYSGQCPESQVLPQETASGFFEGIRLHTLFIRPDGQSHVVANLIYSRLKLPVLVSLFVLLTVNYPLQRHFREEKARQQTELKRLQQKDDARQSGLQKNVALMQEFRRLSEMAVCLIADRVAAAVPAKVKLQCLTVNPVSGRIEEKKELRVQSPYVYVEGIAAGASEVSRYTEQLEKECQEWKVRLLALEKEKEGSVFKIGIQL